MAKTTIFNKRIDEPIRQGIRSWVFNKFQLEDIWRAVRHEETVAVMLEDAEKWAHAYGIRGIIVSQIKARIRHHLGWKIWTIVNGEKRQIRVYESFEELSAKTGKKRKYYQRVRGMDVPQLRVSSGKHRKLGAWHNQLADVYDLLIARAEARRATKISEVYDEVVQEI